MSSRIFEISGITDNDISPSSQIEVILPQAAGEVACIEIVRVIAKIESGSATEYQISIGNVSGFLDGSVEQKYLGSETLSSVTFDESDVRAYGNSSSDGSIFIKFNPNIGSDNQFSYSVTYRI